jgi:4-amino-4-deoxy-L-arabinose transferase-like glycosyltransferase
VNARRNAALFFAALFAVTLALRMCHAGVLWADEDYHLAAGIQTLHGKLLYRDLWYDKPPLAAWVYAAMGGLAGWPLRLFDALYVLAVCAAAWRFARDLWGRREAMLAAVLMAFFLNFDLPAAVIPIAPDFFLLLPHILAVHCAWKGKPLAAGLWSGAAFLFHAKGVFVLAACALVAWRALPALALGFAIPNLAVLAGLAAGGALPRYFRQVWEWSAAYAASSPELHPLENGLRRTADWLGFHAALALGAAAFWWENRKRENYWLAGWLALSFAGVALGARFYPRYYLQLLPPAVLLAARGFARAFTEPRPSGSGLVRRPALAARGFARAFTEPRPSGSALVRRSVLASLAAAALLIPLVRFGPRYVTLAHDLLAHRPPDWADVALDRDSQVAAALVNHRKHPGDTLFVWGYRPAVFVYTRMPVASRFWDSQPLTGVPADRHLRETTAVLPEQAARNRREFAESRPTFVVDSLSLSNPRLSVEAYPELRGWLAQYKLVARTPLSLIYELQLAAER